jgi:FtsP/CotA-like multicopper oxidase with cupredoxin domain
MEKKRWLVAALAFTVLTVGWGAGSSSGQSKRADEAKGKAAQRLERLKKQQMLPAERRAAGARFKQMRARVIGQALAKARREAGPVATPEAGFLNNPLLFWSFSGVESGPMAGLPEPSGAPLAPQVIIPPPVADPRGIPHYFGPYPNYANSPMPRGAIAGFSMIAAGSGYASPAVVIYDLYGTGTGAAATPVPDGLGGIASITLDNPGSNYTAPVVYIVDTAGPGTGADALATLGGPWSGGLRKFVDRLPGLDPTTPNEIGQYIPVAIPVEDARWPGCDYYEIELGQYYERLHSDLAPTLLVGYRQTNTTDPNVSAFHYLGPLIVAQKDRPVRIKFTNNLPTGAGGNLFIPVDTTLMGAGETPNGTENYTQNRAEIHLHGGDTPWISDGTPYQWTTPAGEATSYPHGVSVYNVPDMPEAGRNPAQGILTYYYPNTQSARLMFYHDHAVGITRLNVYAGEAAGYLLTDAVEADLITGSNTTGVNPTPGQPILPGIGEPIIIQDKTFVDPATILSQDPTWAWGSTPPVPVLGDLWMPHVYMPNQNPGDIGGMNAFGRWHYGPWFWPPTNNITFPPVDNPYYDPINAPWEPLKSPNTPNPSMAMEAFMDTPLVNGTVYPYMVVEPKLYRLRVLNACNDRFVNLQLYRADDNPLAASIDGRTLTEVRMVPAVATPGYPADWPTDGREGGVPDPAMMGPSWIQIGTEGGFLPAPVVIPPQPVDWNLNATNFNFGNVSSHSLLLGPAERADVLVDFSAFAGQTLILYNDAPAAFPALDPRYDYYTGMVDQTSSGGTPPTKPGFGPNTRTIMQIRVGGATSGTVVPLNMASLNAAFQKGPDPAKRGVFEVSQPPIIVPDASYNAAYQGSFPADPYVRIFEASKTFQTLGGSLVTIPLQPKAIQDEMGEAFDFEYGRMSGFLGVQVPATAGAQQFTLYPYGSPPIEIIKAEMTPMAPVAGDGTQLWKITHNGVDTHTIHFHLFNVQLVNRVAWDNAVAAPDPNELGWKETVRVNPLEDTIVALRPVLPTLPFDLPNSIRPIDLSKPLGAVLKGGPGGFKDPLGNPVSVINHDVNWGWEYVLHCHLLGHEEMDMMHGQAVVVAPNAPTGLAAVRNGLSASLTWTDNSLNETGFTVEKAADPDFLTVVGSISVGADVNTVVDAAAGGGAVYYRVLATNVVGDVQTLGFPVMSAASGYSNVFLLEASPAPIAPTNLTLQLRNNPTAVRLRWLDNSTDETGFAIERAIGGTGTFAQIATFPAIAGTGQQGNYTDSSALPGMTYDYRVAAMAGVILSPYTNIASITLPGAPVPPLAPSGVTAVGITWTASRSRVNVTWTDNSNNETGFEVQMASDSFFTRNVTTSTVGANITTFQSANLRRGTAYFFRVRSLSGATVFSAWVNATPLPVITP